MRVWIIIVLVAAAAVLLCGAFLWYLDSVGSADGPNEGLSTPIDPVDVRGASRRQEPRI
jgi:hypothetical protein